MIQTLQVVQPGPPLEGRVELQAYVVALLWPDGRGTAIAERWPISSVQNDWMAEILDPVVQRALMDEMRDRAWRKADGLALQPFAWSSVRQRLRMPR